MLGESLYIWPGNNEYEQLNHKKAHEQNVIDSFIGCYPGFPKGKLIKAESPDFILQLSRRNKIGLEISRAFISAWDKEADPHYERPDQSTALDILYQQINEISGKKEEKLSLYRKRILNAYWLIIVMEDSEFLKSLNIANHIDRWSFFSSFDKLFLFDYKKGSIYTLNKTN